MTDHCSARINCADHARTAKPIATLSPEDLADADAPATKRRDETIRNIRRAAAEISEQQAFSGPRNALLGKLYLY